MQPTFRRVAALGLLAALTVSGCASTGTPGQANLPGLSGVEPETNRREQDLWYEDHARWQRDGAEYPRADFYRGKLKRIGYFFDSLNAEKADRRIERLSLGGSVTYDKPIPPRSDVPRRERHMFTLDAKSSCVYLRTYAGASVGGRYESSGGGEVLGSERREGVYCAEPGQTLDDTTVNQIQATLESFW